MVFWIFIGNYIFLNLFLAILLDGFTDPNAYQVFNESLDERQEIFKLEEVKKIQLDKQKEE